jgi:putative ABC transport system permease protein
VRALLAAFSLTYFRRHPLRVLLSLATLALGVALYVSVDVSHSSAGAAFRKSAERLAGKAALQVSRGRMLGVEEAVLGKLDAIPGVKAVPVLQRSASVPDAGSLLLLGVDFARESAVRSWNSSAGSPKFNPLAFVFADAVVVPERFASKHRLSLGKTFAIDTPSGPKGVMVGAVVKDEGAAEVFGGAVAAMPLRSLQRLFGLQGRLDRVELVVDGDVDAAAARVKAALGEGYVVQAPPRQNSLLDEALTRLEALIGISVISLLVGLFIIYNTVAISVMERGRDIGILRAIGTTRSQIVGALLLEWGGVGFLGSAAGLGLGVALAGALLRMTAGEVNQVTMVADVDEVVVLLRTIGVALGVGTATSLLAAFFPARAAMGISPLDLIRPAAAAGGSRERTRFAFWVGAALVAAGILAFLGPFRFQGVGLLSCFLGFVGIAVALPQATAWTATAIRPLLRKAFRLEGFLAADNLSKSPQRTALTMVALAGSLAMMISTSAIILSFKERGRAWIGQSFPFDVSISGVDLQTTWYANAALPSDLRAKVGALPEVDSVCGTRVQLQDFGKHDVLLFAVEIEAYLRMQKSRGAGTGFVPAGGEVDLRTGKTVVVSRNFAALHGRKAGDEIELSTLKGPRRFRIAGIYEDYTWPQGSLYLDRGAYREAWGDEALSTLDVRFRPGVDPREGRKAVLASLGSGGGLHLYDADDLKRVSDDVLDRTLRFTNAQVAVAGLIGLLGIVNTLLISVMRRTRELGLLRVVGMSRGQAAGMVVLESVFMAVLGGALGVVMGLAAAGGPLLLHVEQISGYAMPLSIPWTGIGLSLAAGVLIGGLAGVIPARRAAGIDVLEAIKYE